MEAASSHGGHGQVSRTSSRQCVPYVPHAHCSIPSPLPFAASLAVALLVASTHMHCCCRSTCPALCQVPAGGDGAGAGGAGAARLLLAPGDQGGGAEAAGAAFTACMLCAATACCALCSAGCGTALGRRLQGPQCPAPLQDFEYALKRKAAVREDYLRYIGALAGCGRGADTAMRAGGQSLAPASNHVLCVRLRVCALPCLCWHYTAALLNTCI